MPVTTDPTEQPFDHADFRRRLLDEYKILQDKMDKIGGFRFTIKGWSVTAVIATSAAGAASKNLSTVIALSFGLAVMLFFFFQFERDQVELSRLLEIGREKLKAAFARWTVTEERLGLPRFQFHSAPKKSFRQVISGGFRRSHRPTELWHQWTRWWRVSKQADIHFYGILIVLSFVLPAAPRRDAVRWHLKQIWNDSHHSKPVSPRVPCGRSGIPPC